MQARTRANAPVQPLIGERILKSPFNDDDDGTHGRNPNILSSSLAARRPHGQRSNLSLRSASSTFSRTEPTSPRLANHFTPSASRASVAEPTTREDEDDIDYVTVDLPGPDTQSIASRPDKASRVLGIRHRKEMEPIPASTRTSLASARSARSTPPTTTVSAPPPAAGPTLPLASLYVVSGLPKSPHTWTLADPDSVMGLHHTDGAVGRWWRPEVLGSTVSPGAGGGGGGKRKKKGKQDDGTPVFSSQGHLSKQDVGKMLSKALKLSFPREVEIIASTLQPASTVHTFTYTLPAPATPLAPSASTDLLRASVMTSNSDPRASLLSFPYPYGDDPFHAARPSSAYLGPSGHGSADLGQGAKSASANQITYHASASPSGPHADAERTSAIRRTLEPQTGASLPLAQAPTCFQTNSSMTIATARAARHSVYNVFRLLVVAHNPLAHPPLHLLPRLQGLFLLLPPLPCCIKLRRRPQRRRREGTPHRPRARPCRYRRTLTAEMVNNPRTVPYNRVDIADQVEEILVGTQAKTGVLDKLHAKHVPGFSDRSAEEREIEAAAMDITT
ncbi:hypothetical protein EVJ58_g10308 [Rhodofomes roseus]|uniref:Uncharacterized protein n=1 Tax=Rhodofomes roseus TaxID=34475 RepID=A0A4Y9XQ66_9APHY|nr:hypothetical protein EVJ58_g10308 [Rhodofomes roseus]